MVTPTPFAIDDPESARLHRVPYPVSLRRERLLAAALRGVDWGLRRWYGVREFTDDPACLLRIASAVAPHTVTLADGQHVDVGSPIIILHLWNEQVPRFRLAGPDFGWAINIRRRLQRSFHELACYLERNPELCEVRGIHAYVSFGSQRRRWQIRCAAARFGFELIEDGVPAEGLHERGEDFLIWAFTRVFNPAALRRRQFRRDRTELWISREKLLRLYL